MMKKILLLLLLAAPQPAMADDLSRDLAACAGIADDAGRLACYDTLASREAEAAKEEKTWFVSSYASRSEKTENVFMSMDALEPVRDASGLRHTPALCIHCSRQKTGVYVVYGARLSAGAWDIEETLDGSSPQASAWEPDKGMSALHRPGAVDFLRRLMKHKMLTLKIMPPNDRMQIIRFPVSDLKKAIVPLRRACGW